MPTFDKCDGEVRSLVADVMEKFHGDLTEADVTIDCLFAFATTDSNGDTTGVALKNAGYRAAAKVRKTTLKERTKGAGDAEIVIDGDGWPDLSEDQQRAPIDHELQHLQLVRDKDGKIKRDDRDRPKLKIRPHDRQLGWFDDVVRRHGNAALEFQSFNEIHRSMAQLNLAFMEAVG